MIRRLLNFLLPPECLLCEEPLREAQSLCGTCFQKLNFVQDPQCCACGYPLQKGGEGALCAPCLSKEKPYKLARFPLVYDETSRELILKLKHCDRPDIAIPLGKLLYQTSKYWLHEVDIIMPVPLHRWRLWKRRYNQATFLARALRTMCLHHQDRAPEVITHALRRVRKTESQGGKSARARMENLRAAFRIKHPDVLKDKTVLLIDDVYTTGATINACTRLLKRSGVKDVYVLGVGRVVSGQDLTV